MVYTKIVRASHDWNPAKEQAGVGLKLVAGELIGVYQEDNGFFKGFNLEGKHGAFPCNRGVVVRTSTDSFNNVIVLGRRSLKGSSAVAATNKKPSLRLLEGSKASPRNKIVAEIVNTEFSYLQALESVCASFKRPMEATAGTDPKRWETLFQNIEQIRDISRRLVGVLGSIVESWSDHSGALSTAFLETGPFMACYGIYASGFAAATKELDKLQIDPTFSAFMKGAKTSAVSDGLVIIYSLGDFVMIY